MSENEDKDLINDPDGTGQSEDIALTHEGAVGANLAEAAADMGKAPADLSASTPAVVAELAALAPAESMSSQERDLAKPSVLRQIMSSSALVTFLSVVIALVVGAILICATNDEVKRTAGYLFARPSDFFVAVGDTIGNAYLAMFRGAIFDYSVFANGTVNGDTWVEALKPLTETAVVATPLILAGLGLAIAFQAGVFNIGAQGQVLMGAFFAGWIGFALDLPAAVQLVLAVVGGAIAGAIWAGIAGLLKAKTGAHEVIVTIMLNYVALYFLQYILNQKAFQAGKNQPKSPNSKVLFPRIFELGDWRLNWGFIVAILAAVAVWFLMNRTTLGFRFRAVGANPNAARTAGVSVAVATVGVMLVAGSLAGLAGTSQVLGTEKALTLGIAGTLGFDAITVALLGRSKPMGVVFAGLLFGALSAGGRIMQTDAGTPIDMVLILQSVIVLLIAAPPLVRAIFRLPAPGSVSRKQQRKISEEVTA